MQDQRRVVIDYISPSINGGDFYIKRVVNEIVNIKAHILADGHDVLAASVLYKHERAKNWKENRINPIVNNEWEGLFTVEKQGFYSYKIEAWVDYALNWQHGIERKIADNQHVNSELLEGVNIGKHFQRISCLRR
jgi:starch synthase (maltosyl-transferring)